MSKTLTVKGLNRVEKMLDVNYFNSITSDEWNETNRKRGIMNKGIVIKKGERLTTEEFEGGNFPSSIFGHPVHHNAPCQPVIEVKGKDFAGLDFTKRIETNDAMDALRHVWGTGCITVEEWNKTNREIFSPRRLNMDTKVRVRGLDHVRQKMAGIVREHVIDPGRYAMPEYPIHRNARGQVIPITTEEGKQTKEDKARARALEIKKRKERQEKYLRSIEEVIFHDPYTTIKYYDGHKVTVAAIKGDAKIEGDEFDKIIGFYAAVAKDLFGDHATYRDLIRDAKVFEPGYLEVARTKSRANRKKERQAGAPARAKKAKAREKQAQKDKKARLAEKKAGK